MLLRRAKFLTQFQGLRSTSARLSSSFISPHQNRRKTTDVYVSPLGEESFDEAKKVADDLQIRFLTPEERGELTHNCFIIEVTPVRKTLLEYYLVRKDLGLLNLQLVRRWRSKFSIDPSSTKRRDPLYRALFGTALEGSEDVVVNKDLQNLTPVVVDATSGFGGDALTMASYGCKVLMIEQNPIVHYLTKDMLQKARDEEGPVKEIMERIELYPSPCDAKSLLNLDYFGKQHPVPDIVYLDAFDHLKSNKGRSIISKTNYPPKAIVGNCSEASFRKMLEQGKMIANDRVVAKKPYFSPLEYDTSVKPLRARSYRFDVHFCQ